MRTTVTLDADVENLLRKSIERGKKTFKQALNDALRRGLKGEIEEEPPYEVKAQPMGLRGGIDPARLRELDDELEIDEFVRKTQVLMEKDASS